MKHIVILSCLLVCCACPSKQQQPQPQPPPNSDACITACANVKAVAPECPEGQFADCSLTCAKVMADPGMPHPDTACLSAAKSALDVRLCGWSCNVNQKPSGTVPLPKR